MFRQTVARRVEQTGCMLNYYYASLPTANFRTRPYSTEPFQDLIEEGKAKKNYSVRSQKSVSVIQRIKQLRPDEALNPAEGEREIASSLSPRWSRDDIEEAIHRASPQPRSPGGKSLNQGPKKKFTSGGKNKSRPKPASATDFPLSDLQALSKLAAPGAKGGAAVAGKGRRGSKRSASLYGQEEEADHLGEMDENDTSLLEDEHWGDVDPDDMRLFRQLITWRNPVTSEPGEPALFKQIKTGYETFAEERTRFELKDTSLTTSHRMDPAASDYSQYLPDSVSGLAARDAGSIDPAQLVKLNLALSHDLTLRQRENVATAVEEFLSRAQSKRNSSAI